MVTRMREKLIELIGQVQDDGCDYSNCFGEWDRPDHIENSVLADHLIAKDAVQVVLCKDCTQYNGHRYCHYFAQDVLDNDFCSYGERKDNG